MTGNIPERLKGRHFTENLFGIGIRHTGNIVDARLLIISFAIRDSVNHLVTVFVGIRFETTRVGELFHTLFKMPPQGGIIFGKKADIVHRFRAVITLAQKLIHRFENEACISMIYLQPLILINVCVVETHDRIHHINMRLRQNQSRFGRTFAANIRNKRIHNGRIRHRLNRFLAVTVQFF